jgi:hypothetical protein
MKARPLIGVKKRTHVSIVDVWSTTYTTQPPRPVLLWGRVMIMVFNATQKLLILR